MAFPIGNTPLAGYPMSWGSKYENIFDHTGPASYAQFVAPSTGGDIISADSLGMGGFDKAIGGVDTTGQILALVFNRTGGNGNASGAVTVKYWALVTATLGGQSQTINTQIAATTDLSTFSFRIQATMV